jgi:hypothetical protein
VEAAGSPRSRHRARRAHATSGLWNESACQRSATRSRRGRASAQRTSSRSLGHGRERRGRGVRGRSGPAYLHVLADTEGGAVGELQPGERRAAGDGNTAVITPAGVWSKSHPVLRAACVGRKRYRTTHCTCGAEGFTGGWSHSREPRLCTGDTGCCSEPTQREWMNASGRSVDDEDWLRAGGSVGGQGGQGTDLGPCPPPAPKRRSAAAARCSRSVMACAAAAAAALEAFSCFTARSLPSTAAPEVVHAAATCVVAKVSSGWKPAGRERRIAPSR